MAQDKKEHDTRWPIADRPNATHERAELDPQVQDQLGKVFRNCCDGLIKQPIPEKFVSLLAKLEAKRREEK